MYVSGTCTGLLLKWDLISCLYLQCTLHAPCSDLDPPTTKKPRTTSVLVEQAGQADKVLIDQVANMDSIFEEVSNVSNYIS